MKGFNHFQIKFRLVFNSTIRLGFFFSNILTRFTFSTSNRAENSFFCWYRHNCRSWSCSAWDLLKKIYFSSNYLSLYTLNYISQPTGGLGALAENQRVNHHAKSISKLPKVFIQNWQGIYWQNFQRRLIDIQLNLFLIITKNLRYLKISNWTQQLKVICLSYWKISRSQNQQELTQFQENF